MGQALEKVDTLLELQALTGHADRDIVVVINTDDFWRFREASTTAHDGVNVIKPDNVLSNNPGRWHRMRFSAQDLDFEITPGVDVQEEGVEVKAGATFINFIGATVTANGDGVDVEIVDEGVTFPLHAPDGLAVAPSYSFSGDNGTGMYRPGAEFLDFAIAGFVGLRLRRQVANANPQILCGSNGGSATYPYYSVGGDDNTGMYLPGDDTVRFSAGGTEHFRVTTEGAQVTGKLTVTGSIDPTDITLSGGGTAHWQEWGAGSTAPVSSAGTGRLRYNESTEEFEFSANGGAYQSLGGGGGVTYPLLADDGAVGAPAYSFSADPNTGIFRSGDDTMALVAGGEFLLSVSFSDSNPQVFFPDGTVSNPPISFYSSPSSGINHGTDSVTIITSGEDVAHFISDEDGQRVLLRDGSAEFPALACTADQDTGLMWLGSGVLVAVADGQDVLQVINNGAGDQGVYSNGFLALNDDPGVAVSDAGTARLRYNDTTGDIEASTDGGAYAALGGGGGAPRIHSRSNNANLQSNFPSDQFVTYTITFTPVSSFVTINAIMEFDAINGDAEIRGTKDASDIDISGNAFLFHTPSGENVGIIQYQNTVAVTPDVSTTIGVKVRSADTGDINITSASLVITEVDAVNNIQETGGGGG